MTNQHPLGAQQILEESELIFGAVKSGQLELRVLSRGAERPIEDLVPDERAVEYIIWSPDA